MPNTAVYSDIILRCANFTADLLAENGVAVRPVNGVCDIDRIITHKNPHLDEFAAILLFRGCLPPHLRCLPLRETILRSSTDIADGGDAASVTESWHTAAVIGIGGTHAMGASAKILFDEHTKGGGNGVDGSGSRGENSVAALVKNVCIGRKTLLPRPLFMLLREVDCIDGYGGAHGQNLSNYVKALHSVYGDDAALLKKEAVVYACITALMLGMCENADYTRFDFFRNVSIRSFDDFCNFVGNDSFGGADIYPGANPAADSNFSEACGHIRDILSRRFISDVLAGKTILTYTAEAEKRTERNSSERVAVTAKTGRNIRQHLLVPYIIPLLYQYWGGDTAALVTSVLWYSQIAVQLDFLKVLGSIRRVVTDITAAYDEVCDGVRVYFSGAGTTPAVLAVDADVNGRTAVGFFLNNRCGGEGYTLFRNTVSGNVVISKGRGCDENEWEKLAESVAAAEGETDDTSPGCWHITRNAAGLAPFIVNGNAAHQYVPRSELDGAKLFEMLSDVRNTV